MSGPTGMVIINIGAQELSGHANYGTEVMINSARIAQFPVEEVFSGEEGKVTVFRWSGCLFIGCCIPPRSEVDGHFQQRIGEWMNLRKPSPGI